MNLSQSPYTGVGDGFDDQAAEKRRSATRASAV